MRETIARYGANESYAPHAIVVTAPLRSLLAEFLERTAPGVAVYAFAELPPELALEPAGVIRALIPEHAVSTEVNLIAASRAPLTASA